MHTHTCLVTGGAGYIGSHCCKRLLEAGHRVVVFDNLFRGHARAVELLAGRFPGQIELVRGDLNDTELLAGILAERRVETVLHFAALAYVGESVDEPTRYFRANVSGGSSLLEAIEAARGRGGADGVRRFVFSSSCATYGDPPEGMVPVPETCPQSPTSPYGRTKLIFEWMLRDYTDACRRAGTPFSCAMLRYFNVAGCDRAGLLGEHHEPETHLVPVALQTAMGKRPGMAIFGTDYPTRDGTCVRDYVHVEDLAQAHVCALDHLDPGAHSTEAYNVGIGRGYSVREVLESVRRVTGVDFPIAEHPRRAGDAVELYNDPARIMSTLGWQPEVTDLDEIVRTAWDWMRANPDGYTG